ncbi:MAG TPA: type II toxin-antitoxin system prevent-host-death family antitoxin [Chthoniobacterales bacterium]|nr:type II toxin-antitoxin system prevent-host-death family antitoxin [Chthoniobacterales bacterium]
MKTMTVAEFKARFSEVLDAVRQGESIAVTYGRSKRTIAVFQPPTKEKKKARPVGLLEGKVSFKVGPDFEIDDSELLSH